ncbi:spore coat protein [Paenibacillus sp. y28]|uniref:spore coat protein n=1 Tax=Paenibacillus sp. y28 TaxID=3129110 RepID=UPI00301A0141
MYASSGSGVTTKELAYLSDSMKNEELLTKLCVQGAVEAQNPQLQSVLAQLAQQRQHNYEQLFQALQQKAGFMH